jgi:hypothetical protein
VAGRGIRVPFVAEVSEWLRGTRAISDDLDGLSADLRDTARDADRVSDQVGRDLVDAADDGSDAFRKFARDVDDSLDRVRRDADRTGEQVSDDLSDGLSRGKGRVGAVGSEVADEFTENFGEAIRSGNPADAVLETFTSLGPALGVLGIGAAVAAGIVNQFVRKADEQRARITGAAASLFDDVIGNAELTGRDASDAFVRGWVEAGEVGSRLSESLGTDTVVEAWQRVGELVQQTGLDEQTVTSAVLGTRDALDLVEAALRRNDDAADAVYQRIEQLPGTASDLAVELDASLDPLDAQADALREIGTLGGAALAANERNRRTYELASGVVAGLTAEQQRSRDAAAQTAERVDRIRRNLVDAGDEADTLTRRLREPVTKRVVIDWENTQLPEGIASTGRVPGRLPS